MSTPGWLKPVTQAIPFLEQFCGDEKCRTEWGTFLKTQSAKHSGFQTHFYALVVTSENIYPPQATIFGISRPHSVMDSERYYF